MDDLEEAQKFLTEKGFVVLSKNDVSTSMHAKALIMKAPSGYLVNIFQHIK